MNKQNKTIVKTKQGHIKTIKRMSRNEFLLRPALVFKDNAQYRRRLKHKADYTADF